MNTTAAQTLNTTAAHIINTSDTMTINTTAAQTSAALKNIALLKQNEQLTGAREIKDVISETEI